MPYCPYCGVEVDQETRTCPLCNTPIPEVSGAVHSPDQYPRHEHNLRYSRRSYTQKERKVLMWFISLVLTVPFTIVVVSDLFLNRGITWSIFPIVGLAGVWLVAAIALFHRTLWRLFFSYFFLTLLISFLLNLLAGSLRSFMRWYVPIILLVGLLLGLSALYAQRSPRRGNNIAGLVFWAIAVFCFALDVLICHNQGAERFVHGWSLIAASALVPLGGVFMYLHYRVGRTFSLKRFFKV